MVLVDTSIWVDHFRAGNPLLKRLLTGEQVVCHPFIIGELACCNLRQRSEIISLLKALPQGKTADNDEILDFIEQKKLMAIGIGLIDIHLLASSLLTGASLWTTDIRLRSAAAKLEILYQEKTESRPEF